MYRNPQKSKFVISNFSKSKEDHIELEKRVEYMLTFESDDSHSYDGG